MLTLNTRTPYKYQWIIICRYQHSIVKRILCVRIMYQQYHVKFVQLIRVTGRTARAACWFCGRILQDRFMILWSLFSLVVRGSRVIRGIISSNILQPPRVCCDVRHAKLNAFPVRHDKAKSRLPVTHIKDTFCKLKGGHK